MKKILHKIRQLKKRFQFISCLLLLPVILISGNVHSSKVFYRYKNDQGELIFNSYIPKEYVDNGYTVVDPFGGIIEEVPPALTKEDIEKLEKDKKQEIELQNKIRKRAEADKMLMSKFAEPEDAERARDRQLETLDIYIGITRGNIKRLEAEMALENEKAANMERSGKSVSKEILESIDRIKKQIKTANDFIALKESEKDELKAAFELDIQRLILLKQGVVEK